MRSEYQEGRIFDYTPGSDVASDAKLVIGNVLGVAVSNIKANQTGAVRVKGVVWLPKTTGAGSAMNIGEGAVWDASAGACVKQGTAPAAGDLVHCGVVAKTADDNADVVAVSLNEQPATKT